MKNSRLKTEAVTVSDHKVVLEVTMMIDRDQAAFLDRTGCARHAVESITSRYYSDSDDSINRFFASKSRQWTRQITKEEHFKGCHGPLPEFIPYPAGIDHARLHRRSRHKVRFSFNISYEAWEFVALTARYLEIDPEDWCAHCFGHRHFLGH